MPARRTSYWALIALMWTALAAASFAAPAAHAAKTRTIVSELRKLYAAGTIDRTTYLGDLAIRADVNRRIKRLTGVRRTELAGALATAEGMAARGALTPGRLYPVFLTLQRNAEWWSALPLLASGQRVSFIGSELVWQYVPGQGLQLHPLANFGKLNAYARGSRRNDPRTSLLLDELLSVGVPRGGGLAWEYYFTFDGGRPPWVSGLAQGTGLQAIARAATRLGRMPELLPRIQQGLRLFETPPPTGVRVETPEGIHYAQYSFWPELQILNGFVQSLVGLFDVAQLTGDPRAAQLYADGERAARVEVPAHDTGAWSLYSRGAIERESDLHYHVLLRDFLSSLCDRTADPVYCGTEAHFTTYLTTPPTVQITTTRLRGGAPGKLRFVLSKISRASVSVTAPDGRRVLSVAAGVIGHGRRDVVWAVPRKPGVYVVRVDATDLAGHSGSTEAPVEVLKAKRRKRPAK
jgi:hypothetical protein